jgi:hypothetical protein
MAQAAPQVLADPSTLQAALIQGHQVQVRTELAHCRDTASHRPGPADRAGFMLDSFRIRPDGTLAFLRNHAFVQADGQAAVELHRWRVLPDRNVTFQVEVRRLPSYEKLHTVSLSCEFGRGVQFFVND